MRAVVQRVKSAEVRTNGQPIGGISAGLLIYAGVEKGDASEDVDYVCRKITGLRVFEDDGGRLNLDVTESGGGVLVVSQFTLSGDARKGRRPSFDRAEEPERAKALYKELIEKLRSSGLKVAEGEFQAYMEVASVNDGPITILLDSRKTF